MNRSIFSIFQDSLNSFEGQETDEEVHLLLRRHPLHLLLQLFLIAILSLTPLVVEVLVRNFLGTYGFTNLYWFLVSLWFMGAWILAFQIITLYSLSTVIITTKRIIESTQHGFFNREISELRTDRIQDVTAHTNGLIETIFKFGDITIQTAASEKKFVFQHIPHPERVKDKVMRLAPNKHS